MSLPATSMRLAGMCRSRCSADKGTTRFTEELILAVCSLASLMTWKNAVLNVPFGGVGPRSSVRLQSTE